MINLADVIRRSHRGRGRMQVSGNESRVAINRSVASRSKNEDQNKKCGTNLGTQESAGSECSGILLEHADECASEYSIDEKELTAALLPPFVENKIQGQYRRFRSSKFHLPSFITLILFETICSVIIMEKLLLENIENASRPSYFISAILCAHKICVDFLHCFLRYRSLRKIEQQCDVESGKRAPITSRWNDYLLWIQKIASSLCFGVFLIAIQLDRSENTGHDRSKIFYYTLSMIALCVGPLTNQLFNTTVSWRVISTFWMMNTIFVIANLILDQVWSHCYPDTSIIWSFVILFLGYVQYQQERSSITEYRYMQAAVRIVKKEQETRIKEEKLDALKRSIHATSHDLKTPLQAMSIALQTCKSDMAVIQRVAAESRKDSKRAVAAVDSIFETFAVVTATTTTMESTINRALDFYRLNSGLKLTPNLETFDLRELILSVMATVDATNNGRSIPVLLEPIPADICSHVTSDKSWLAENMLTMLLNSVKYNRQGKPVHLSLYVNGDEDYCGDDMYSLKFEVSDLGIGLPEGGVEFLFDANRESQAVVGGSGLGLYCLRERCYALGGDCGAGPRMDGQQGAVIWMSIPYLPDNAAGERMKRMSKGSSILRSSIKESSSNASRTRHNRPSSRLMTLHQTASQVNSAAMSGGGSISFESDEGSFRHARVKHSMISRRSISRLSEENTSNRISYVGHAAITATDAVPVTAISGRGITDSNASIHNAAAAAFPTIGPNIPQLKSSFNSASSPLLEVLVIEDSSITKSRISRALETHGYKVARAESAEEALSLMKSTYFELVVLDEFPPDGDGKTVISQLRRFEDDGAPGRHFPSVCDPINGTSMAQLRQIVLLISCNDGNGSDESVQTKKGGILEEARPFANKVNGSQNHDDGDPTAFTLEERTSTAKYPSSTGADFIISRSKGVQQVTAFILEILSESKAAAATQANKMLGSVVIERSRESGWSSSSRARDSGAASLDNSGRRMIIDSGISSNNSTNREIQSRANECPNELRGIEECSIDSSPSGSTVGQVNAQAEGEAITVLAVDDSPPILKVICRSFDNAGFKVETAKDGSEGLSLLMKKEYDVLLTDIQMPVLDGIEMVRRYRELERSGQLKMSTEVPLAIIGMSASDASTTRANALQAGMDEFMSKPCSIDAFILHLSRLLEERWQGRHRLEIDPNKNTVRKIFCGTKLK